MTSIKDIFSAKAMQALCLFAMLFAAVAVSSCSDDDPFFSAGPDDAPRILNTDIPEWQNGKPSVIASIKRNENFKFTVLATPIPYTTVEWYLDGEKIFEGADIDMPIKTGDHTLKIVAFNRNHPELSTSRTCQLIVSALPDDPSLGTNTLDLWVAPGATTNISGCTNTDKIAKVLVGGVEAQFSVVDASTISLTAPESLGEGSYAITLIDAEGNEFGGGLLKITNEPKPILERTIWSGSFDVTWGSAFEGVKEQILSEVSVGSILRVYVTGKAEGAKGYMATADWRSIITGNKDEYIEVNGDYVFECKITQLSIDLMKEYWGFAMVGDGYTVTKVTVE